MIATNVTTKAYVNIECIICSLEDQVSKQAFDTWFHANATIKAAAVMTIVKIVELKT